MRFAWASATDSGKVRDQNEDSLEAMSLAEAGSTAEPTPVGTPVEAPTTRHPLSIANLVVQEDSPSQSPGPSGLCLASSGLELESCQVVITSERTPETTPASSAGPVVAHAHKRKSSTALAALEENAGGCGGGPSVVKRLCLDTEEHEFAGSASLNTGGPSAPEVDDEETLPSNDFLDDPDPEHEVIPADDDGPDTPAASSSPEQQQRSRSESGGPPADILTWVNTFSRWSPAQRILAVDHLISACQPSQVRHMLAVIEPQFQRDFISFLPKELSLYVLAFLSPKDLTRAAQTCRYWRILCEDNLLWREKCREAGLEAEEFRAEMLERCLRRSQVLGFDYSANKASFMRQHNIEMNWRVRGIRTPKVLKGHDDHVITCLQFNNNRIVSGSDDNTLKVRIQELSDRDPVPSQKYPEHRSFQTHSSGTRKGSPVSIAIYFTA